MVMVGLEPVGGGSEKAATKEISIILGGLPLAKDGTHLFLPEAEGAVLVEPLFDLMPTLYEGFMSDFDGFLVVFVAAGNDEAVGGKLLDKLPVIGAKFSAVGKAAGVFSALTGLDELAEDVAGTVLFFGGQILVDLVSVGGEGTGNATNSSIGGVGEPAVLLVLPEEVEGKLQEG